MKKYLAILLMIAFTVTNLYLVYKVDKKTEFIERIGKEAMIRFNENCKQRIKE